MEENKKLAADYRDKGLQAQKVGDYETALVYFQKAVEMDPSLAVAYNDLGVLYEARGWNDKAKLAYGKAIDLDPMLPGPYYNLGSIYAKEGDYDKAVSFFKQRVLVGEWNDVWTAKARLELQSMGVSDPEIRRNFLEGQLARTEAAFDIANARPRGNDLDPRSRKRQAKMHFARGKQLSYMGQQTEALQELSYAFALDPKNKEVQKALDEANRRALTTH